MFDAGRVTATRTPWVDRLPEMLEGIRELVECESPSADQAAGDGAHAEHEHVLVEHIVPRTALLAALLRRLLHGEGREADVVR